MGVFTDKHTPLATAGPLGFIVMAWGGVNVLITLVYLCMRVFGRARSDAAPRR